MSRLKVQSNVGGIEGLCIIEPKVYCDSRGYFTETYNEREFNEAGLYAHFVQDNHAFSVKGVLRGLHINKNHPQCKLLRVVNGSIFDVVVDLRKNSRTYKKWFGIILSSTSYKQLYIPEGLAHGYLVLSESADVMFKVTEHYRQGDEISIAWDSPELDIKWPIIKGDQYILNNKDKNSLDFSELNFE